MSTTDIDAVRKAVQAISNARIPWYFAWYPRGDGGKPFLVIERARIDQARLLEMRNEHNNTWFVKGRVDAEPENGAIRFSAADNVDREQFQRNITQTVGASVARLKQAVFHAEAEPPENVEVDPVDQVDQVDDEPVEFVNDGTRTNRELGNEMRKRVRERSLEQLAPLPTLEELGALRSGARLGGGAYGSIYPLETGNLDVPPLVVKTFTNPQELQRELDAFARVGDHPNILRSVGLSPFVDDNGVERSGIVMESLGGGTFESLFESIIPRRVEPPPQPPQNDDDTTEEEPPPPPPLPPAVETTPEERVGLIQHLFRGVLEGLLHLDKCGLDHHDVKPGNLMFDESGTPRIIDLGGIAPKGEQAPPSLGYAAPNILRRLPGDGPDSLAGLYSLAASLFEVTEGTELFRINRDRTGKVVMQFVGDELRKQDKLTDEQKAALDRLEVLQGLEAPSDEELAEITELQELLGEVVNPLKSWTGPGTLQPGEKGPGNYVGFISTYVDFMNRALSTEPTERLTPEEALAHPFLTDGLMDDKTYKALFHRIKGTVPPPEPVEEPEEVDDAEPDPEQWGAKAREQEESYAEEDPFDGLGEDRELYKDIIAKRKRFKDRAEEAIRFAGETDKRLAVLLDKLIKGGREDQSEAVGEELAGRRAELEKFGDWLAQDHAALADVVAGLENEGLSPKKLKAAQKSLAKITMAQQEARGLVRAAVHTLDVVVNTRGDLGQDDERPEGKDRSKLRARIDKILKNRAQIDKRVDAVSRWLDALRAGNLKEEDSVEVLARVADARPKLADLHGRLVQAKADAVELIALGASRTHGSPEEIARHTKEDRDAELELAGLERTVRGVLASIDA